MTTEAFRNLEVWQLGISLVKKVYSTTKEFPIHELYTLTAQMRRSAVSAPSNIAEGSRRRSLPEFIRFLNISLGSLAELETQIVISQELAYIREAEANEILELIDHMSRKIVNLERKLSAQHQTPYAQPR